MKERGKIKIKTYELNASYDSRQSFYGKAKVIEEGNKQTLISHNAEVAIIENGIAKVNDTYSQTTLRHIKEFLLQNGFNADNKKYIEENYMI